MHPQFKSLPYDLVEMLQSPPPQDSNPIVSDKWKELGPVDLAYLMKQTNLDGAGEEQNFGESKSI